MEPPAVVGAAPPLIATAFSAAAASDEHGDGPYDALGDSDDEAECRVCRGEAEPDRRLFAPCKCSGSIRFTHSDCLEQWLEHSGKSFCELCGHKFEFKPLYDAAAPDVLPWSELVATVASMAFFKWAPFLVRAVLVVVLWLGLAPWCTSWLYRMWLLRASAMVNVNFSERFDAAHAIADIYAGIILIVVIIFSFLALMSFADFLRFHLDHIDEPQDEPPLHNHNHHVNHHHAVAGNGNGNGNGIAAAVPPLAPRHAAPMEDERRPLFGDHDDEDEDDELEQDNHHLHDDDVMPFPGVFDRHPREELGLPGLDDVRPAEEDVLLDERRPGQELRQRRVLRAPRDINVAPNNNRIPEPPLAPRNAPALPAPPPRNNRPNPPPANNRDVWEDDFDHMEINIAMDELLGLRGDIVVLFRNVSWLLAFNGAYLGLFAFIPYTLGSTILSASMKIYSALPPTPLASTVVDESVAVQDLPVGQFFLRMLAKSIGDAKQNGDCLQLVDLCTCFFGYLSICFTIVLWRWMVNTASPFIHRPLMGGVMWALRCLTAIVKVSTLLMLKMVVLPIVLGIGIDLATLRLFHVTLQDRIVFCLSNMIGSLLVHWVLGITFMLFITVSVLQLREVMHPDILAKLIRPQEAHPDLLRSLLSETCMKHARRMLLSLVIYAALLVVLIHVPIRLYELAAPSFFPLVLRFQHYCPEIQVPVELLIVHLVVLGILEHAKNEIGRLQHVGIVFFCSKLGLTEYLLPRVEVNWPSRVDVLGDDYVLGPPPLHFHPQNVLPPDELRIGGRRYLPWPEDGLEDPQPVEYELLRRQTPTKWLHARVATLAVVAWLVLVSLLGGLICGTFFLGRACMAPFERLTGISHDPLALAAGVQIVWYLANGLNALNVITMPEEHVEPALVRRGYCVKNMTPEHAISCVIGWAFLGPFFVGYLMSACFPDAKATWFEAFWMGYAVFNLATWFICCFHMKRNRRRRRNREQPVLDEEFDADMDFIEDELDEMDDELDDEEELLNEVAAAANNQQGARVENHADQPRAEEAEPEGVIPAMRKCYKQLMFNVQVHDNDAVRLRENNIADRCFDIHAFMETVMYPILGSLLSLIVVCSIQSLALIYLWPSSATLSDTAFAISLLATGTLLGFVRCGSYVSHWTTAFAESIRNERYLIGRELQDMVR